VTGEALDGGVGLTMTVHAELHRGHGFLPHRVAGVDIAMTLATLRTRLHMLLMAEIDKIRQVENTLSGKRRLSLGELGVAYPASFQGRETRSVSGRWVAVCTSLPQPGVRQVAES
jgi:hypothetical protein